MAAAASGREMVLAFARHGADVVIASRRIETCEEVAEEVREETGRQALPVACHVGRWDDLERLTDAAYDEFGHVDVLVNNAGMAPVYPSLVEASEELFDKVVAVNLKGPFRLSALVGERMVAGDGGSMINISSIAAQRPQVHDIPYAAAKAGLNTMTLGLATALGPKVRVNCVMVGPFLTDISKAWDVENFKAFAERALPAGAARLAARDRRHRAVPGVRPVELHHRHRAHRRRWRVGVVALPVGRLKPGTVGRTRNRTHAISRVDERVDDDAVAGQGGGHHRWDARNRERDRCCVPRRGRDGGVTRPRSAHYITNKHAINGFTKAVAFEYGTKGITSNAICPGAIETALMMEVGPKYAEGLGMTYDEYKGEYAKESMINRLNSVEEVAAMAVLLASDAGAGITGALLNVDGGTAPW